jgi:RNA polymerase primary sigma factor
VAQHLKANSHKLNQKEKEILSKYYGVEDFRHTLAELGEIYGVTRERIRQIKVIALFKIGIKQSKKELK